MLVGMNIAEIGRQSKALFDRVPKDALIVLIVLLFSTASFGLGVIAGREEGPGQGFAIEYPPQTSSTPTISVPEGAQYLASKNGTRYHLPWCSGAKSINEANRVWFSTKAEAEAAGYTPAANCKGI